MEWMNKHYGLVRRISPDRATITIKLPRGGTATAHNEGFDVGDAICFTLDPSGRRVLRVLPRDVAEAKVEIACSRELRHAIMETDNPETKGEHDGDPSNKPSDGQAIAECLDICRRKPGEDAGSGDIDTADTDYEDNEVWLEDYCLT